MGGAWAVAGKIATGLVHLAAIALIARLLSPEAAAVFFLAQSVVALGAMVGRLGLELTAVRLVSQALGRGDEAAARGAATAVLGVGAAGALAAGATLTLGGAAWVGRTLLAAPQLAEVAPAIGVWTLGTAMQWLISDVFRGFHAIRESMIWGGLASTALVVLGLSVLSQTQSPTLASVVWIWAAAVGLIATSAGALLAGRLQRLPASESPSPGPGSLLGEASPLLLSNVMGFVLLQADLWIVSAFSPPGDVATYAAASRLVGLVGLPLLVANQVVAPLIGDLHARGETARLERLLRGVAGAVALPAASLAAVYVLLGHQVLGWVYGTFYVRAWPILAVLTARQLVTVLTGSCGYALIMTGRQRAFMRLMVASAAVMLAIAPAAAKSYGAFGVASTVCIVLVAQQVAMLLLARRLTGCWTHVGLRHLTLGITTLLSRSRNRGA